jgi:hypothetical protein
MVPEDLEEDPEDLIVPEDLEDEDLEDLIVPDLLFPVDLERPAFEEDLRVVVPLVVLTLEELLPLVALVLLPSLLVVAEDLPLVPSVLP